MMTVVLSEAQVKKIKGELESSLLETFKLRGGVNHKDSLDKNTNNGNSQFTNAVELKEAAGQIKEQKKD